MKNVSYDDDDYDDGYDSPDPEEQEILERCTAEVLAQLLSGEPSVTASRDEVQEALWHYYNDVEKSVNYLRGGLRGCCRRLAKEADSGYCASGKKAKEIKKQSATPPVAGKGKGKLFAMQCLFVSVFARGWARIARKVETVVSISFLPWTFWIVGLTPSRNFECSMF
jgi:elongation factor 1 alpha-like protein